MVQRSVEKATQRAITDLHFQLAFTTDPLDRQAIKEQLQQFTKELWKKEEDDSTTQWEALQVLGEQLTKWDTEIQQQAETILRLEGEIRRQRREIQQLRGQMEYLTRTPKDRSRL